MLRVHHAPSMPQGFKLHGFTFLSSGAQRSRFDCMKRVNCVMSCRGREAGRGTVIKVCTWPFPGLGTGPGIEPSVTPLSNTFPSSCSSSCSCSWCWIHFHSLSQSTLIHPCPPLINRSVDKKPCQSSSNHSDPLIL